MSPHLERITKSLHTAHLLSSDLQALHANATNPAEQDAALNMIAEAHNMIYRLTRLEQHYRKAA